MYFIEPARKRISKTKTCPYLNQRIKMYGDYVSQPRKENKADGSGAVLQTWRLEAIDGTNCKLLESCVHRDDCPVADSFLEIM